MHAPHTQFFDLWSLVYDTPVVQRTTYHPIHDAVLGELTRRPPRAVLDVACGTGQLATRVRKAFPRSRVVGCDFSAGMLQHAAARAEGAGWVRADAARLPFADRSFDVLTCTEAFHWFPDQDAALAEFYRVLAAGGRALVALINPRFGLLSDVTAVGSRLVGEPFYWPTADRFQRTLCAAGFSTVVQHRVPRLPGALLFPAVLSVAQKATRTAIRSAGCHQGGLKHAHALKVEAVSRPERGAVRGPLAPAAIHRPGGGRGRARAGERNGQGGHAPRRG